MQALLCHILLQMQRTSGSSRAEPMGEAKPKPKPVLTPPTSTKAFPELPHYQTGSSGRLMPCHRPKSPTANGSRSARFYTPLLVRSGASCFGTTGQAPTLTLIEQPETPKRNGQRLSATTAENFQRPMPRQSKCCSGSPDRTAGKIRTA